MCIDYGGHDEIIRAVNQAIKKGEPVTEESFAQLLDTKGTPDPDLIIRTSGEVRLSGFLMWQSAHAEYHFCDAYWPEFRRIDFLRALRDYQRRTRRFGR